MLQSHVISEPSFTSFLSESLWLSIERAFEFKGSYFDFVYISSEQFLFADLRQRRAGQIRYALVVPPRDFQLRHLAVIPLRLCLVHQRRMTLTPNNHC